MKDRLAKKIKDYRPFQKHDVIVYAVLALFVAILFLSFVVFPKNQNANGFSVTKNGQKVLSYSYQTNSLSIESYFTDLVQKKESQNELRLTIYTSKDKKEFNVLLVDKKAKTVDVIDANCSTSKECVHMPKISGNGTIVCAPHGLAIICGFIPPMVG